MKRAGNPWDRFYRYHEAPWRGERSVADVAPWLGDRVLELGCGNGKMLRPLQEAGVDVVGLDIAWHALKRLKTGILADAAVLPFQEASFSCVLDIHCTGHLDQEAQQAAAVEAKRVLRPGGHLVVERLGPGDLRSKGASQRTLEDGRSTWFEDASALVARLESAGFSIVDVSESKRQPRFRGAVVTRHEIRIVAATPP